jgi:hypothetical protein
MQLRTLSCCFNLELKTYAQCKLFLVTARLSTLHLLWCQTARQLARVVQALAELGLADTLFEEVRLQTPRCRDNS